MRDVKRFEIITPSSAFKAISLIFKKAGINGYTVIPEVKGSGERGYQPADEISEISGNIVIITAVKPENESELAELLRPMLKRYGGVCLVTDAKWLRH